ncbi:MAG: hypothetical protein HYX67_01975 [Candidatus Melainabacteria bacterium]|nr:hypothetical protein [Candidatus Melainabacteria bacterium]
MSTGGVTVSGGGLTVSQGGVNITGGITNSGGAFDNGSGGIANAGGIGGVTALTGAGAMSLGTMAANALSFLTSGAAQMSITAAGNVGVGTTTPTARFQAVSGSKSVSFDFSSNGSDAIIKATSNNTNSWVRLGTGGSPLGILTQGSDENGSTPAIYVGNNGKVALGSNSPAARFHVYDNPNETVSSQTARIDALKTSSTASITKTGLDIQSTGSWSGSSAVNIGLNVNATGGTTNYAALFSGGSVGVGTTTPSNLMTVYGGTGTTNLLTLDNNNTPGQSAFMSYRYNGALKWAVGTGVAAVGNTFSIYNYTAGSNSLLIDAGGNVGIGTSSPGVSLDVAGGVRAGTSTNVTACGSGSANGEGTQRFNYTTHNMEYCNGTSWVSVGNAGGLVFVDTQVPVSNVIEFTGLNSYSYSTYFMDCFGIEASAGSQILYLQIGDPTLRTTQYNWSMSSAMASGGNSNSYSTGGTSTVGVALTAARVGTGSGSLSTKIYISNFNSTTKTKNVDAQTSFGGDNGWSELANSEGYYYGSTNAASVIRLSFSSANITSGQCNLYGLNASGTATTVASTGSGTSNYIAQWTSSTALGNSPIAASGSNVGIGTTTPGALLDVNGTVRAGAVPSASIGNMTTCSPLGAVGYDATSGAPVYCANGIYGASGSTTSVNVWEPSYPATHIFHNKVPGATMATTNLNETNLAAHYRDDTNPTSAPSAYTSGFTTYHTYGTDGQWYTQAGNTSNCIYEQLVNQITYYLLWAPIGTTVHLITLESSGTFQGSTTTAFKVASNKFYMKNDTHAGVLQTVTMVSGTQVSTGGNCYLVGW